MSITLLELLITLVVAIVGSTGLWSYLQTKRDKKDGNTQILLGLGHDRICHLGKTYISRGYITKEEYENLIDYLWTPYSNRGGNGSAARIVKEVETLPIRDHLDMIDNTKFVPLTGGNRNAKTVVGFDQGGSDKSC